MLSHFEDIRSHSASVSFACTTHLKSRTFASRHFLYMEINKARDVCIVCVCVCACVEGGTSTQQNRKCFELYIPAISDKLREGFVINHKHAALHTKRIAWWAAP